jgi:hypothetical protein
MGNKTEAQKAYTNNKRRVNQKREQHCAPRQVSSGLNLVAQGQQAHRDSLSEKQLAALRLSLAPLVNACHSAGVHACNSGRHLGRSLLLQTTVAALQAAHRAPAKVVVVPKGGPTSMRRPMNASNLKPKDCIQTSI